MFIPVNSKCAHQMRPPTVPDAGHLLEPLLSARSVNPRIAFGFRCVVAH
jgi:hypothetical protein